ncbi:MULTISPECIES: VanZ family protein [unclassified Saccharopolyspora]|uniref:VanZ family protein n=1 Tax=unclassified Saccharopolyspora TaxID=2646250 RepID=UPI001CD43068|nr:MULTISPECIES: VanZ family protein [unclassified Saccharopolyspora]MCA1189011.1 VanZ family protein [Saccharopolyspora sp. 6T]MCA1281917.1 VanZ family protein [Saccharopolyspora sp. 7B]
MADGNAPIGRGAGGRAPEMLWHVADAYLLPIRTAAVLFPLLAFVLLVPVAVVLYRRHGVMRWWALSFYAFLYYLITAYCLVLMPLPGTAVDVCREYPRMGQWQLTPGNTFADVWKESGHRVTFGDLVLHNSAVIETGFNLLLLLPLGVFLRYHFRRGPWTSLAVAAAVALSFEVTQGTGVFGIYPCPYRLFDVDDLVVNTLGAMLGWWLGGQVGRAMPALNALDERVLARHPVPFGRRAVALVLDIAGAAVLSALALVVVIMFGLPAWWGPAVVFGGWFVALPAWTGATPGKRLLLLELVDDSGARPAAWRLLLRAVVLAMPFLPPLLLVLLAADTFGGRGVPGAVLRVARSGALDENVLLAGLFAVVVGVASTVLVALYALVVRLHPADRSLHELASGVHNRALPHHNAPHPVPAEQRDDEPAPAPR